MTLLLATGALLSGGHQLELTCRVDADIDGIVDAQEQRAGILHAPVLIGNGKLRVGGKTVARQVGLDDEGQRTAYPMQRETSQNLNFEVPLRQDLPLHLLRREGDLRILGAF